MFRKSVLLFTLTLSCFAFAQEKKGKKSADTLPDFVVSAQTVAVVIMPDAAEPISNPNANRNAQSDVENAFARWGRLRPVLNAQEADLVVAVRKGTKGPTATMRGGGIDDRPVVLQPNGRDVRIGVQHGTIPSTTRTQAPTPEAPQLGTTIGSSEDALEVYRGHDRYPLDGGLVWSFHGKDGLNAPNVPAVTAFRKALERTIQQQTKSQPGKP